MTRQRTFLAVCLCQVQQVGALQPRFLLMLCTRWGKVKLVAFNALLANAWPTALRNPNQPTAGGSTQARGTGEGFRVGRSREKKPAASRVCEWQPKQLDSSPLFQQGNLLVLCRSLCWLSPALGRSTGFLFMRRVLGDPLFLNPPHRSSSPLPALAVCHAHPSGLGKESSRHSFTNQEKAV